MTNYLSSNSVRNDDPRRQINFCFLPWREAGRRWWIVSLNCYYTYHVAPNPTFQPGWRRFEGGTDSNGGRLSQHHECLSDFSTRTTSFPAHCWFQFNKLISLFSKSNNVSCILCFLFYICYLVVFKACCASWSTLRDLVLDILDQQPQW